MQFLWKTFLQKCTYSLPWLGVDFGSWCYKTFVFWLRDMSEWPWHPLDRPCKWPDGRNRPIWRPNGHPVDHKCWLISTGLARCHYPMAKCDSVAPIKLFLVAAKTEGKDDNKWRRTFARSLLAVPDDAMLTRFDKAFACYSKGFFQSSIHQIYLLHYTLPPDARGAH